MSGYSKKERIKISYKTSEILKYLTEENLNIIYSAVCLNNAARNIYKKKISNFFQIYTSLTLEKY